MIQASGEIVNMFHLRLLILGQSAPHEGGVGLVHLTLALSGNGVEYDAGLARAGYTGEHHDLALWDVQRHIFQIVLPESPKGRFIPQRQTRNAKKHGFNRSEMIPKF